MTEEFLYLMLAAAAILLFFMIRNEWVYRLRIWMIDADIDQYKQMPSYDAMFYRFWIWTARGFGWKR